MIIGCSIPHFAERTFGIKAKQKQVNGCLARILPKELLESRQSSRSSVKILNFYFAERTFGIKAKLPATRHDLNHDFAERTFGIKAKQIVAL